MSESVTLPALGESVTEGTVTRWLKKVGDRVEVDEPALLRRVEQQTGVRGSSSFAAELREARAHHICAAHPELLGHCAV